MMNHLDEIRGRLNAATPGPWERNTDNTICQQKEAGWADVIERGPVDCGSYCYGGSSTIEGDNLDADAEFIANAPTDVARLLSAVQAVLDLHKPLTNSTSALHPEPLCTCDAEWPCETVEALTTALEGR